MTGPVQVLVVGLGQPHFSGTVIAELDRLRDAGTVRLLDVMLVSRADDGTLDTLPPPPDAPPGRGALAARLLGESPDDPTRDEPTPDAPGEGLAVVGDGSAWSLADAIPPGTTAAVAIIEHLWAAPLRDAIRDAGGTPLDEAWLASADVERLNRLARG